MPNGGEASELVHMLLQGSEVAIRLGGSIVKNVIAFLMALRQKNKVVYGKKSLPKLMKNFADTRGFTMTWKDFQAFRKEAKGYKFPYAGVSSRLNKKGDVDLILPQEFVELANLVFEKIGFCPAQKDGVNATVPEPADKKKEHQPTQSSRDTKARSTTRETSKTTRTNDAARKKAAGKPSVEGKLLQFHKQVKAKQAAKPKARVRAKAKGPKR